MSKTTDITETIKNKRYNDMFKEADAKMTEIMRERGASEEEIREFLKNHKKTPEEIEKEWAAAPDITEP